MRGEFAVNLFGMYAHFCKIFQSFESELLGENPGKLIHF